MVLCTAVLFDNLPRILNFQRFGHKILYVPGISVRQNSVLPGNRERVTTMASVSEGRCSSGIHPKRSRPPVSGMSMSKSTDMGSVADTLKGRPSDVLSGSVKDLVRPSIGRFVHAWCVGPTGPISPAEYVFEYMVHLFLRVAIKFMALFSPEEKNVANTALCGARIGIFEVCDRNNKDFQGRKLMGAMIADRAPGLGPMRDISRKGPNATLGP